MAYVKGTGRKKAVKDRSDLAAQLCKMEGRKSQVKIGDMRQTLKLLVKFDAEATVANKKSAIIALRREAVILAHKKLSQK